MGPPTRPPRHSSWKTRTDAPQHAPNCAPAPPAHHALVTRGQRGTFLPWGREGTSRSGSPWGLQQAQGPGDPGTQAHRTKAPRHGAPTGPCGRWPSAAPQGRPCQASEASPGPAGASPLPGVLAVLCPQRRPTCSPAHLASARGAREPRTETKLTRVRRAGRHSLHTRTLKKNHSFDSSAKKNLANLQQNCQVIKARHFTHELKLLIKIPSLN